MMPQRTHAHVASWTAAWRMTLAQITQDEPAWAMVAAEVGDCPTCWARITAQLSALFAAETVYTSGGIDAATANVEELLTQIIFGAAPRATWEDDMRIRKPVDDGQIRIRLRLDFPGQFHGHRGLKRGDIVAIDYDNARRYFRAGYAQPADVEPLGRAHVPYIMPPD